ncbi:hypothetical protein [Chlorella virus XW01]|nr:hypothetical protein [Chlorella virus XW01]
MSQLLGGNLKKNFSQYINSASLNNGKITANDTLFIGSSLNASGNSIVSGFSTIGDYMTVSGNVGIGVITPSAKLEVSGNSIFRDSINLERNLINDVSGINFSDGSYIGYSDNEICDCSLTVTYYFDIESENIRIRGPTLFTHNVDISGDLYVRGSTITNNVGSINVTDSFITLNQTQDASGNPTNDPLIDRDTFKSGLVIYRGPDISDNFREPYLFIYDQEYQRFRTGISGETLSTVANIENEPINNSVSVWNHGDFRFVTDRRFMCFPNGDVEISGSTILKSNLQTNGNVDLCGSLMVYDNTLLYSNLTVNGNTTLTSTLNVSEDTLLSSRLDVINDTSLNSNLEVSGNTLLSRLDVINDTSLNSNLEVSGNTLLLSRLDVIDDTTLNSNLEVGGNTLLSRLDVINDASLNSNLEVSGNLNVLGDINLSGYNYKNNVKTATLYIVGTGLNLINRVVYLNGTKIVDDNLRGLNLVIIDNNLELVSSDNYDTYSGNSTIITNLVSALNNITKNQIGILTSYDSWEFNTELENFKTTALKLGLTKIGTFNQGSQSRPYASIFYGNQSNFSSKDVIERMEPSDLSGNSASINCNISTDGTFVAIHGALSVNALYSSESNINEPLLIAHSNGNIGINSNIPTEALDIVGKLKVNNDIILKAPSSQTIKIIGDHLTADSRGEITLYDASTNNMDFNVVINTGTIGNGRMRFLTRNTERMTITNTGDVGIGVDVADIDRKLHVRGDAIRIDRDSNSVGLFISRFPPGFGATPWKTFFFGVDGFSSNNGQFVIDDFGTNLGGASTRRLTIDNTGNIGIATNSPLDTLHVNGNIRLNTYLNTTNTDMRLRPNSDNVGVGWVQLNNNGTGTTILDITLGTENSIESRTKTLAFGASSYRFNVGGSSGMNTEVIRINSSGDVSLNNNLEVIGNSLFRGRVDISGDISLNNLEVIENSLFRGRVDISGDISLNNLEVIENSLFRGRVDISGDISLNNLEVIENSLFRGRVDISSDISLNNNLDVSGDTILNGSLVINKNITILGDLSMNGNFIINDDLFLYGDANIFSSLNVDGNITTLGNLDVDGNISAMGDLDINGNTNIFSSLIVDENISTNGNLEVSGNTLLLNRLDVNSDVSLNSNLEVSGNSLLNTVNITGDVSLNSNLEVSGNSLLNTVNITGDVSLNSDLQVNGNSLLNTVNITGDVSLNSDLQVNGNSLLDRLNVINDVSLNSDLQVNGNSLLDRLNVINDVSLNSDLQVNGNSLLNTVNITGDVSLNSDLQVSGNSLLNTVNITGDVSLNSDLQVSGNSLLNTVNVSGDVSLNSDLQVSGNTLLNTVNITGDVEMSGNLTILNESVLAMGVINPTHKIHLPNISTDIGGRGLANAWNTYSDLKIKSNIRELDYGLIDIMRIEPKRYFQHDCEMNESGNLIILNEGEENIGLIAQDLNEIIPEVVSAPINENTDLYSVDYGKMVTVLIKAIQDLSKENDDLKRRVEILEQNNNDI